MMYWCGPPTLETYRTVWLVMIQTDKGRTSSTYRGRKKSFLHLSYMVKWAEIPQHESFNLLYYYQCYGSETAFSLWNLLRFKCTYRQKVTLHTNLWMHGWMCLVLWFKMFWKSYIHETIWQQATVIWLTSTSSSYFQWFPAFWSRVYTVVILLAPDNLPKSYCAMQPLETEKNAEVPSHLASGQLVKVQWPDREWLTLTLTACQWLKMMWCVVAR